MKRNFSWIHEKNCRQTFIKINQKLKLFKISQNLLILESWKTWELFTSNLLKINIVMIDIIEFCWNIKKKKHETFVSNFYKIDWIIEDRMLTLKMLKKKIEEHKKENLQAISWLTWYFFQTDFEQACITSAL